MAARQAVISLLKSLGEQQDDDIVDYIASVLEDADDDASADPDGLEELLSGAAPAFGALPGERRTAAVLDLFAVRAAQPAAASPAARQVASTRALQRSLQGRRPDRRCAHAPRSNVALQTFHPPGGARQRRRERRAGPLRCWRSHCRQRRDDR